MARHGYDLQLTRYDERGWRATFYTTGMEHSPASATGTGWERTPLARDTASGVGGVEEGGNELTVRVPALPRANSHAARPLPSG
jgi:hypothetical protein